MWVNLNYDLMFDLIIQVVFNQHTWPVLNEERESLEKLPTSMIPSIKLHGTIGKVIPRDTLIYQGSRSNPWLNNDLFHMQNDFINHPLFTLPNFADCEFLEWPWLPELVPPGRAGDDLCHPLNKATSYAKDELSGCKYLVVCGVSAVEPDTAEIRELMTCVTEDTYIFHIDIDNPEKSAPIMSSILKKSQGKYFPVSSTNVPDLKNVINSSLSA